MFARLRRLVTRKNEKQMRDEAAEQLEQLFELSPDGILVIDDRAIVVRVNANGAKLFGWSREALIGQSFSSLIPNEPLRALFEQISGFFARQANTR